MQVAIDIKPNLWLMYEDRGVNFGVRLEDGEREKFDSLPRGESDEFVDVRDVLGNLWRLKRANCGAGCYCAAQGVVIAGAEA